MKYYDVTGSRNSLNNLGVIPGKLAVASDPESRKSKTSGYPLFDHTQGMLSWV